MDSFHILVVCWKKKKIGSQQPFRFKSIWVWVKTIFQHPLSLCDSTVWKVPDSEPHWWALPRFGNLHFQLPAVAHQPRHNVDMYLREVHWTMPLHKSPIKVQSCAQRRFYLWRHRKLRVCVCVYVLCKKSISQGVSEMNLTSVSLTCCLQRCCFRAFLTSPQTLSENWKREQS